MLTEHRDLVAEEVLATSFGPGAPDWPATAHQDTGLQLTFWLRRVVR